MKTIAHPPIVSREQWLEERKALLQAEKELTRAYDSVCARRKRLPMVEVEKAYTFHGHHGEFTLSDLFGSKSQLIVYHFMFDPEWDEGCPGCTGFIDALGNLSLLEQRDTRFVVISRAPHGKLERYRLERGWDIDWYSSLGSDFNYDFHATLDPAVAPVSYNYKSAEELAAARPDHEAPKGEAHGLSVFFRTADRIFHTYSTYARGCESVTDSYRLLDLTPYGRQEDFEDAPEGWPQKPTYGGWPAI